MKRHTLSSVIGSAALVALLGGCGLGSSLAGVHDAPPEPTNAAPLSAEGAQRISARVLNAAASARTAKGAAGQQARSTAFAGPALAQAELAAKTPGTPPSTTAALQRPEPPQVLAVSRGSAWPRAILVGTLDKTTKVQTLHALTSGAATQPFKVFASVTMLPGASVPAIGAFQAGAPLVGASDKAGGVAAPATALKAYGAAMAYPKPVASPVVGTKDAESSMWRNATASRAKAHGSGVSISQVWTPGKDLIGFRLKDGGSVVFGQLTRTDTATAGPTTAKLTIPADVRPLVGGKTTTPKSLQLTSLDSVIMVIPAKGAAQIVGAQDQRVSAKAT